MAKCFLFYTYLVSRSKPCFHTWYIICVSHYDYYLFVIIQDDRYKLVFYFCFQWFSSDPCNSDDLEAIDGHVGMLDEH